MVAIVLALWLGSLIAGWHNYWLWLLVPIGFFFFHAMWSQKRAITVLKRNGISGHNYRKQMALPNARLIGMAIFQHGALFGLGFLLHRLF